MSPPRRLLAQRHLTAAVSLACVCAARATSAQAEGPARLLRCEWPDGTSVGVIHRQGAPLALTAGAVAGARECATRSTAPAQAAPGGGWLMDWPDAVLGDTYRAELGALAGGGFSVVLSTPSLPAGALAAASAGASQPVPDARVRCGPLSLPARAELRPGDPACHEREDRSQALQEAWHTLRHALTEQDAAAFRRVALPQLELAEGSSADSPRAPAASVAAHLACVAGLARGGASWASWARARPNLLVAPTGLDWQGDAAVSLGGYGGMTWQAGRWRLAWLNASRAVILRRC